jgi:hypothetical protein
MQRKKTEPKQQPQDRSAQPLRAVSSKDLTRVAGGVPPYCDCGSCKYCEWWQSSR